MKSLEPALNGSEAAWVRGRGDSLGKESVPPAAIRERGLIVGSRGGSSLDGAGSLPVTLVSSVAFSLNDTLGLWLGGLWSFLTLPGSSKTSWRWTGS